MVKNINEERYTVKKHKIQKIWKNKSKLFGHVIYHALHCSKIATNNSHHLPNEQLQFLCIKTLYLQSVFEINSEWLETLQLAGVIGVHWLVPVLL